ncbi:MAG: hypothetical protein JXA25_01765 [Anaerolineales bacterium]|nr:hypothetical protein [Anaerolineales bacterium]
MTKKKIVSRSTRVDADKQKRKAEKGTREKYQGTFEAEWTCTSCGREHIPGSEKICPACSNPRQTGEDYREPDSGHEYLSKEKLADLGVDPGQHLSDETCRYCQAKIKPGTQVCPNCGASLADTGYNARRCPACERETNELICPGCGAETVVKPKRGELDLKKVRTVKKLGLAAVLGIGGFLVLCLAAALFLLIPKDKPALVSAVSWTSTIELERYEYNRHEGWSLPEGADLVSSTMAVHHYDQELTGYVTDCSWEQQVSGYEQVCDMEQVCETVSVYDYTETICYDDGTCDDIDHYRDSTECHDETVCSDEPVYEQVEVCREVPQYVDVPVEQLSYTYDIWEWEPVDPVTLTGSTTTPAWPEVPQENTIQEAQDGRSQECEVTLVTEKGKTVIYQPPCYDLWLYEEGTEWKVRTAGNEVLDIAPAE